MNAALASSPAANSDLAERLRQMIAVLQTERQALAAMDLDALLASAAGKQDICDALQGRSGSKIDAECEGLIHCARELNDVNRRVRNLLAVNVAARLDALAGTGGTYSAAASSRRLTLVTASGAA